MLDDYRCIACKYPLRGLDPNSKCPECGLDVMHSIYGQGNARLHTYEEKMLARASRYRSHRGHALGFALASFLCAGMALFEISRADEATDATTMMTFGFLLGVPFWMILAHAYHVRAKYVESIEHARKQIARAYEIHKKRGAVIPPPSEGGG